MFICIQKTNFIPHIVHKILQFNNLICQKPILIQQFDYPKALASVHPAKIEELLTSLMKVNISSSRWLIYSTWLELNKLAKFLRCGLSEKYILIPSWWRSLSYRTQSTDFQSKSMDWFLYDRDLPHERVKMLEQLSYDVVSCAAVSVGS